MSRPFLYGTALLFNEWGRPQPQQDGSNRLLKILPDAVQGMDVSEAYCCLGHDPKTAFAFAKDGSFRLRLLPSGLMFCVYIPEDVREQTAEAVHNGEIAGASINVIYPAKYCTDVKQGKYTYRTIRKIHKLVEISLASNPARPSTRIAMLGDDKHLQKQYYSGTVLL